MVHNYLFILLVLVGTVLAKDSDSHNIHHYYSEVINHVHRRLDNDDRDHHDDDHTYRFHIGSYNIGPYAYIDDDGRLQGGYIDLLKTVCKRAHKTCYYILDDHQRCWQTKGNEEYPGLGLLFKAYDACIGVAATPERENSFGFTKPFVATSKAGLYFNAGKVPTFSSPAANLTGQVLGFVNGWSLSPKCIHRNKKLFGGLGFTAKYFDTQKELVDALHNGQVEAILSGDFIDTAAFRVEQGGPTFHCSKGLAVIAHYGSELIKWWDHAVGELVKEHGWKGLCAITTKKHGHRGKVFCPED